MRKDIPIRVGLLMNGGCGPHPATAHIRVLTRYGHPSVSDWISPIVLDPDQFLNDLGRTPIDVLVIQRTAIRPERTPNLVETLRDQGVPFIFEIDDDLLSLPPEHPEFDRYRPWRAPLSLLARSAALVTVSTEPLREVMARHSDRVEVLPNMLDERLWFSPTDDSEPLDEDFSGSEPRGLYFGTPSHLPDLEILRPAIERLAQELGLQLWVAGALPNETADSWCHRLEIPAGSWQYPAFVKWLRRVAPHFVFGVAPLRDSTFNRVKSDLKTLEMAALDLPFACSDVEPYASAVTHQVNGLLVSNTPADWECAIRRLATDAALRSALCTQARDSLVPGRLMARSGQQLVDLLLNAARGG